MNRKTFALVSLAILLALTLLSRAATAEAHAVRGLKAACPAVQGVAIIPDNPLTGHGALATPDGVGHF